MQLVVANKANPTILKVRRKSIAGQLVLVLLGLQVFFFTSFVAVDVPTGTGKNLARYAQSQAKTVVDAVPQAWVEKVKEYVPDIQLPQIAAVTTPIRMSLYTPQAPIAIFLGYALGWPIAAISAALFIMLGIIGPFFGINPLAGGGGPDYFTQPGFGYLLGMFVATVVVAKITDDKRTSLRQIGALAAGLVSLHLVGLVYLLASALILSLLEGVRPEWLPWVFEQVRNLSWYPLPYDALLALLLIGAGFPVRYLVNMLTAPDISLKTKNDRLNDDRLEELLHYTP